MNKPALGLAMLAIGLALGLSVPPLLAQSDAPKMQKWEQYCERLEAVRAQKINERLKAYGDRGFQLVGVFGDEGPLYCYRRPMP